MGKKKNVAPATAGSKPVQVFKARGVKVSVFENVAEVEGRETKFYKVAAPQRFYREGQEWKVTQSFGPEDLPVLQHLLQQAWCWILEVEGRQGKEEQGESHD